MKGFTKNFLLLICSITLSFICLEVVLRSISYTPDYKPNIGFVEPIHRYSDYKGVIYELVPNSFSTAWGVPIKINSQGFRGKDIKSEKNNNIFRILVLGDSVTFGPQVEEEKIYTSLLESMLDNYSEHRDYEVINAGVVGYSPIQEAYFLKGRGVNFKPDLVIVGFCLENDFFPTRIVNRSYKGEWINVINVFGNPVPFVILPKFASSIWLMDNSDAYKFLNLGLWGLLKNLGLEEKFDTYYKKGLEDTTKAFGLIFEVSNKKKIPVLVVGIPFDTNEKNKNLELLKNLIGKYDFYFLDMSKNFYDINVNKKDIWFDGVHLNYTGHLIVAESIFDYLKQQQIV